jgi:hypothetical protein
MNEVPETVLTTIAILVGAATVFLSAVWFGQRILAPRIGRAADHIDADEEEPGDRPD